MRRVASWLVICGVLACSDGAPTASVEDAFDREFQTEGVARTSSGVVRYNLILTGEEEVPPSGSQAYGAFVIHVVPNNVIEVVGRIWNPGCETIVAGHIHRGVAGVNGPVVVPLFSGSLTVPLESFRTRAQLTPELAQELRDTPEAFYVNYHSTVNPGGFIRAQLGTDYPAPNPPATGDTCV
jgi:hypothetical protein